MMQRLLVVLVLSVLSIAVNAQVQSNGVGGGPWSDPATWQGGVVPDFNSAAITILSGDVVNVDANFTIDQTTIDAGASLNINPGIVLTINNGTGTDFTMNGDLNVEGELVLSNGSTHAGMTALNTTFQAGAVYRHGFTTSEGVIPVATWDVASTLIISGYTTATTATAGGNWGQAFGNVEWNCISQTATFNLGGLLTTVNGDLTILSTGNSITTNALNFVTTE